MRKFNVTHLRKHVDNANAIMTQLATICTYTHATYYVSNQTNGKVFFRRQELREFSIEELKAIILEDDFMFGRVTKTWTDIMNALESIEEDFNTYIKVPDTTDSWDISNPPPPRKYKPKPKKPDRRRAFIKKWNKIILGREDED